VKRRATVALLAALALGMGACGSSGSATRKPTLTVSAAASLKAAFTAYAHQFTQASVRYSFAGSDMLAAQIEQGVRPEVFASANTSLPDLLYSKHLVSKPVTFAANELVIAVPAKSTRIRTLSDLERPGVTVAIGSASVPIGSYTREVLARLQPTSRARIIANVRSQEPDVSGSGGKLTQGAVDAGFTYITDVQTTRGALKAIVLPSSLQPVVAYGVAIVKGAAHPAQARAFLSGLLRGAGRADLMSAGFLPAPRR